MYELCVSLSGELLVPAWESNWHCNTAFGINMLRECCVPSPEREMEPWRKFFGQQQWPIGCGQGPSPVLGLLQAERDKISRGALVQYGTWLFFPALLSNPSHSFALGVSLVLSVFVSSFCGCNFMVSWIWQH